MYAKLFWLLNFHTHSVTTRETPTIYINSTYHKNTSKNQFGIKFIFKLLLQLIEYSAFAWVSHQFVIFFTEVAKFASMLFGHLLIWSKLSEELNT